MKIRIRHFARFREEAGCEEEWLETTAASVAELWEELARLRGFSLGRAQVLAAMDDEFCPWERPLHEGALLVFIPPVAGG